MAMLDAIFAIIGIISLIAFIFYVRKLPKGLRLLKAPLILIFIGFFLIAIHHIVEGLREPLQLKKVLSENIIEDLERYASYFSFIFSVVGIVSLGMVIKTYKF